MSGTSLSSISLLGRAVGLGMVAGSRSMLAPALFSQTASRSCSGALAGSPFAPLAWREVSILLRFLSVSEIAVDKLPILPDRIAPLPLLGRIVLGAVVGGGCLAAKERSALPGLPLGAVGAILGAHIGYFSRVAAGRRGIPDPLVALVEDAIVMRAGMFLLRT